MYRSPRPGIVERIVSNEQKVGKSKEVSVGSKIHAHHKVVRNFGRERSEMEDGATCTLAAV